MTERGKARSSTISVGSNTTIKATPGTLYRINWSKPTASSIRIDASADLGTTPDLNASGADTIFYGLAASTNYDIEFGPGVGFDGLSVAATSNARVNVIYE